MVQATMTDTRDAGLRGAPGHPLDWLVTLSRKPGRRAPCCSPAGHTCYRMLRQKITWLT